MKSKIEQAQSTCDGLHRLLRRLHGAADDLDKGGESVHEILALLASTSACINNLSEQLHSMDQSSAVGSNVSLLKPLGDKPSGLSVEAVATESPPEQIVAVAGR